MLGGSLFIIAYLIFVCTYIDTKHDKLEESITEHYVVASTEPVKTESVTQAPTERQTETELIMYRIPVTQEEIELLVNVVMAESGNQCLEGQIAVAETIINRVLSKDFPDTITEVIYSEKQYCTVFKWTPTESCKDAVYTALTTQTYPRNMYYFRTKYFHSFGTPYRQIQDHYFSLGA